MMKKTLGIIGGVGPLATMFIGEMIVRRTKASTDQEHVHIIIDNDTTIPDRTAYILDQTKQSPLPFLQRDAKKLAAYGADIICIPCNTAHTFYAEMQGACPVPIVHMIQETAKRARELGAKRVGILATDGTLAAEVYQQALLEVDIQPIMPKKEVQQQVMSVIYDYVKAGKTVSKELWRPIEEEMLQQQCDFIVLGCTELSIINKELRLGSRYIDSLLVLAEVAIIACGYEVLN
ncbi:amino acid racemase [Metasolibacillus meyeri]|uniref:Amino acid racemase n=1 Tax=Metasolibacillus meyeri TaxID=1071052 RepID=A0AAW9NLG7_9BACL|nr:amino acid racemase [Metasolibacillus meyeri]MEC1179719.1 amino acid racemase [Metasolibacillus meyeri]